MTFVFWIFFSKREPGDATIRALGGIFSMGPPVDPLEASLLVDKKSSVGIVDIGNLLLRLSLPLILMDDGVVSN